MTISRARATAVAAGVAGLLLSSSGCASPAFSAHHYDQQAMQSITASQSELQTTRIVLETMLADHMFATTADEIVSASEAALGSVATTFGSVQPPVSSDDVQRRTMRYLGAAQDAATQARIAVRRDDAPGMRRALQHVQRLLSRVDAVSEPLT